MLRVCGRTAVVAVVVVVVAILVVAAVVAVLEVVMVKLRSVVWVFLLSEIELYRV